ncbi:MAG TPA: ATP-binding cassette domain-containing protein [Candidatus Cybelea sp.]|nr:ATP-binding cassette domain-containing protein [Candidatus Cybelea sp.]
MELQIRGLRKVFGGGKVALDGIDLQFTAGVTGLVGPNGSGKTTLLRLLATTLAPNAGQIVWNGIDAAKHPDALRRDLLYVPQNFAGYPSFSAQEFLEYLARLRGVASAAARKAATDALEVVGLGDDRKRRLGAFTPGMMQRLSIAYALQTDAKVVLLDEPTAGLDPGARRLFSNAIRKTAGERITILCTHILEDLEALADRIVALRAGKVAEEVSRDELRRVYADVFELEMAS